MLRADSAVGEGSSSAARATGEAGESDPSGWWAGEPLPAQQPVQPRGSESAESTQTWTLTRTQTPPPGSPLSSSICSSMVSSVYYNSLPTAPSDHSVYVTASELSLGGGGEKGGGDVSAGGGGGGFEAESELSIYDQAEGTVVAVVGGRRRSSPHKVSISSEVEVLLVDEVREVVISLWLLLGSFLPFRFFPFCPCFLCLFLFCVRVLCSFWILLLHVCLCFCMVHVSLALNIACGIDSEIFMAHCMSFVVVFMPLLRAGYSPVSIIY